MAKNGYLVKIIPPTGYTVWRLEFTRARLGLVLMLGLAVLGAVGGYYVASLKHAATRLGELRSRTDGQAQRLDQIDQKASQIDAELRDLERQNRQLRKIIGAGEDRSAHRVGVSRRPVRSNHRRASIRDDPFSRVSARLDGLRSDSRHAELEGARIRRVALSILNLRRLEEVSRARLIAAIPSINPAGDAAIASGFGFRYVPWPEFHNGVDLDANYGALVRATAAGTVVFADWDGGYGIKIDIDHGNGYHTWYAHLSRADVRSGARVVKGQRIALVGSTGHSTGAHLHYQVMQQGTPIDPAPFLSGVPHNVLASLK